MQPNIEQHKLARTKNMSDTHHNLNFIDLFAGAGGMSEGFVSAGYTPIAHVEMNKHACETLKTRACYYWLKNNNKLGEYYAYLRQEIDKDTLYSLVPNEVLETVICEAMSKESMDGIYGRIDRCMNNMDIAEVDLVIGGPPCQAYSVAGRSRKCMDGDPRNTLYKLYLEVLQKYSPKMFVFENVPGLLTAGKGTYLANIQEEFRALGYELDYKVLDASAYGVLQRRKRIILVGWKTGSKYYYPNIPQKANRNFIKDIFSDLPELQAGETGHDYKDGVINDYLKQSKLRNENDILTWHVARSHREKDRSIYRQVISAWNDGQKRLKYSDLPQELISHKNQTEFLDRFKVVAADLAASHTMTAHISKDGHYYIHPDIKQARSITVREAARIQSFPDDFYFEGPRTAAFMQIGNAVPPLMANAIAMEIMKQFKEDK